MQEKIGLKIGKSKVISTSNKVNVDTVDTTSSKGSRFKTLEEDVIVLENRIRGRRLLEPSWTSLIGRRERSDTPDGENAMTGLCTELSGTAAVVINSVDSNFKEIASMLKEAMVEELA
ncbi:hypothetical protein ACOSP7_018262 [Xanthoceras sorbifolium]